MVAFLGFILVFMVLSIWMVRLTLPIIIRNIVLFAFTLLTALLYGMILTLYFAQVS